MVKPRFLDAPEQQLTMCLYGSLCVDESGTVIIKQQLCNEYLNGLCVFEETPQVEQAAVCSETDVDTIRQVLFCLTEHDAQEDGEEGGGQDASLLDAVGDREAAS